MMANLSKVALEGMDRGNSKVLEKNTKNLQQVERQRAKRYMREKWCKSMGTCISSSGPSSRDYVVHLQSASASEHLGRSL